MQQNTKDFINGGLMLMLAIAAIGWSLSIGLEKEDRRQKIVQQDRCAKHGYAIDRWAERKGIENPCRKVGP